MTCPQCGTLHDAAKHFCEDCGAALPGWCPSCGAETTPGNRYCGHCGCALSAGSTVLARPTFVRTATESSTPPMVAISLGAAREERRLVTALFCDLVGFTPLTERLDAEQVRSIQTMYFERMSAEIARFGGNVEKYMGDAVLALFGIPTTVGNDAERAVLCALNMREAMVPLTTEVARRHGVQLAIRVGVNTGEAVSGLIDAGGRREYSVTGDVINTAARLQTAAEPGGIMVGAESMRLARKGVRFGERRELDLKGKAHTVVAYQVLDARPGGADGEKDASQTRLVARDYELGILLHAWERTQDGEGHLVAVMGDAGIGKSRLLIEATERFSASAKACTIWGRCVSHGQGISLWLVADLLRSLTDTRERDSPATVREALRRTVHALLETAADDIRDTAIEVMGEVLGLPSEDSAAVSDDPQVRRQQLVRSLRLMLIGLSRQDPAVLVLEDLHWADAASSEILAEVLADVPGLRLLILAAYRPGWTAPWTEWGWIERLSLRPLAQREAAALAQTILGGSALSSEFEHYITDRSGGNPYFVEELLHALREADGIAMRDNQFQLVWSAAEGLPSTLTEILLARLDRLENNVRDLVQVASVIGRGFSIPLLTEVSGWDERAVQEALAGLAGLDMVSRQPGSRSDYAFKHVTMRDVAYNTLLQARRHDLHARTARALVAADSADESVEIIAYHFSHTEEHAQAALWLERAADRSSEVYANEMAIDHYEEARRRLKRAGGHDGASTRIGEKLGGIFRLVAWYDEALEELETVAGLYRRNGDLEGEARLTAQIGQVHFLRGAPEEAIGSIRGVLERLEGDVDDTVFSRGLAALYMALVDPLYSLNRFEDALTAAWRALELARWLDDRRLVVEATVYYGLALQGIGRLDEACLVLQDAIPLAEEAGHQGSLAEALMWGGDICIAQGRPQAGAERYSRALRISEDRGDPAGRAALLSRLGHAWFILGDWNAAREHYERTVELVRSISFSYFSASALIALGEHYLRQGAPEKASRYLEEPFTLAERSGRLTQIPYLHVPLADWDLCQDRPEEALSRLEPLVRLAVFETPLDHRAMQIAAEAHLVMGNDMEADEIVQRGLRHAEGQGNTLARLGWLQVAAALAAHGNDEETARSLLSTALDLSRSMPHVYEEGRVLYRRGLLNGSPAAREDLVTARATFERLGCRPYVERVQRELEKTVHQNSG